jgi:hypothetical protein
MLLRTAPPTETVSDCTTVIEFQIVPGRSHLCHVIDARCRRHRSLGGAASGGDGAGAVAALLLLALLLVETRKCPADSFYSPCNVLSRLRLETAGLQGLCRPATGESWERRRVGIYIIINSIRKAIQCGERQSEALLGCLPGGLAGVAWPLLGRSPACFCPLGSGRAHPSPWRPALS